MSKHTSMYRRRCAAFLLSLPFALTYAQSLSGGAIEGAKVAAPALPTAVLAEAPPLKPLGGGLLRVFGFQIYHAYLWSSSGSLFDRAKPYVLDLHYLRNISAKQLTERSLEEMRGQGIAHEGEQSKWRADMQRVFPDVKEGDRITGVVTASRTAKFFHNGAFRGEITDPAFTDAFFGIWLGEKSSQPRMRDQLLGKTP